MFINICGEDIISSRNYFNELKDKYKKDNYFLQEIAPQQLINIDKGLSEAPSLFNEKKVFIATNLDKYLKSAIKRISQNNPLIILLNKIAGSQSIILINWEERKSLWDIKVKNIGQIKEFKLKENIFKLLDSCYPKNKHDFLISLNNLFQTEDEQFIFIMLIRHIRNLILSQYNILPIMVPWQKTKLIILGKKWPIERLMIFYEGLYKIDKNIKTGNSPIGVKKSLDILACYCL